MAKSKSKKRASSKSTTSSATETITAFSENKTVTAKIPKPPGKIHRCGNNCGFTTREPEAQALQDKTTHKAARTEVTNQYLCPMCRHNGVTGKLIPDQ